MVHPLLQRRWYLRPHRPSRSEQVALLRVLSLAVARKLALAPMLEAFAEDTSGRQRDRVLRLAELIRSGTELPDALAQVRNILPDDVILATRFGAQSGTLSASLQSSASALARRHDEVARWLRGFVVYISVLLVVLFMILTFIMVKIVPVFQQIFQDYEIPLPNTTLVLIRASNWSVQYWYLLALPVILVVGAMATGAVERSARRGLLARVFGPLKGLHAADVMRNLAVVVQAEKPLPEAVSTLARYHYDPAVRRQLLHCRGEIEHGADLWQAMKDVGLLRASDAEMLEAARVAGNQSWASTQVAQRMTSRSEGRLAILLELLRPALVVGIGAVVGLVVISLFTPLVSLIHSLA